MTEKDVIPIIKDTLDGLRKIHSHSYIHRDMKPENIIFQFVIIYIYSGNRQDMWYGMGCRLQCKSNEKIILWNTSLPSSI